MENRRALNIFEPKVSADIIVGIISGFIAVYIASLVIPVPNFFLFIVAASVIGGMIGFVVAKTKW